LQRNPSKTLLVAASSSTRLANFENLRKAGEQVSSENESGRHDVAARSQSALE